jgi:hypothetical protein
VSKSKVNRREPLVPILVRSDGEGVRISAALWGGPPHQSVWLCVGGAYQLGRELVDHAEALLAGVKRPWDDDPGRVPFAAVAGARRSRAGGAASAGSRP